MGLENLFFQVTGESSSLSRLKIITIGESRPCKTNHSKGMFADDAIYIVLLLVMDLYLRDYNFVIPPNEKGTQQSLSEKSDDKIELTNLPAHLTTSELEVCVAQGQTTVVLEALASVSFLSTNLLLYWCMFVCLFVCLSGMPYLLIECVYRD